MTIPANLTTEEAGTLLLLVGEHMIEHRVCAEVVLDYSTYTDPDEARQEHTCRLQDLLPELSEHRAEELLGMTLEEAIEFNPAE